MADEQTTKNVAYIIIGISFLVMMWFILKQAKQNREDSLEENSPNVAGSDERPGTALNPEQFDEPDGKYLDIAIRILDSFLEEYGTESAYLDAEGKKLD